MKHNSDVSSPFPFLFKVNCETSCYSQGRYFMDLKWEVFNGPIHNIIHGIDASKQFINREIDDFKT